MERMGVRIVLFSALTWLVAGAGAQTLNTGTFLGTVSDPSGAAVPEASVRVIREGTGF